MEAELQLFNVLNLLRRGWGRHRNANPGLLEHVGQTEGLPEEAQPIFRYATGTAQWNESPVESVFQLQLAIRYRF